MAADGSEFKFGLCSSRGSLRGLRLERFRAFSECFAFFREFCKRIGAGQNARALCGGAAGHAAACVHDLSVERDDAHAAAAGARHAHSVIERIADHSAAKGIFDDSAVLFITGNEAGSNRKEARLALADSVLQGLGLNRSKRKEGRAATVAALEHLDGSLTVFLGGNNDILHGGAECRLDGGGIAVIHADEFGNRAMDTAKLSGCRILHNKADGLGKALVFALHLSEHMNLGIERIQLDAGGVQLLLQAVALILTCFEAKFIACDGIFCALRVILCLLKALFTGKLLRRDLLLPGFGGSHILLQRLSAGENFLHGRFHRRNLCGHGSTLRLQKRLLGADGDKLLSGLAVLLCKGLRLLLDSGEVLICGGQRMGIVRDLLAF